MLGQNAASVASVTSSASSYAFANFLSTSITQFYPTASVTVPTTNLPSTNSTSPSLSLGLGLGLGLGIPVIIVIYFVVRRMATTKDAVNDAYKDVYPSLTIRKP